MQTTKPADLNTTRVVDSAELSCNRDRRAVRCARCCPSFVSSIAGRGFLAHTVMDASLHGQLKTTVIDSFCGSGLSDDLIDVKHSAMMGVWFPEIFLAAEIPTRSPWTTFILYCNLNDRG